MTFFILCPLAKTLTLRLIAKSFTPRTPREIHATIATGSYVASVAPSLRALREIHKRKGFSQRTLREYHATNATGSYVASVAPSLRALRETIQRHMKMFLATSATKILRHG